MSARTLSLFEGYGIEIEAMVVDAESLDVAPVVDRLLRAATGGDAWVEDADDGAIGWSNELVNHVIELKTMGPAPSYANLAAEFRRSTGRLNALAAEHGARLMPGGMHPWMDPARETTLWPHDHGPVYRAYDRLFDCRRHGWANLQSVHLNLPFAGEEEFGRLLAAVRLALPLVPALAAASPVMEGRATGRLDSRLDVYRTNAARLPEMAGEVIPEPIFEVARYHDEVLGRLDRALGALGADDVLRGAEWTNARGAIARFDRMAIEVRLIDAQECAAADLAVACAVGGAIRGLVEERWSSSASQRAFASAPLVALLARAIDDGPRAVLGDSGVAAAFGSDLGPDATLGELWGPVLEATFDGPPELGEALGVIRSEGTLAERLLAALGPRFGRPDLRRVWGALCDCLAEGRCFHP